MKPLFVIALSGLAIATASVTTANADSIQVHGFQGTAYGSK